ADARGLFDAGSGFGAEVQLDLTTVAHREEVLAQPWEQKERGRADGKESRHYQAAMADGGFDYFAVTRARCLEHSLETALEVGSEVPRRRIAGFVFFQKIRSHRWHERTGEHVGREHRKDDRFRERNEKVARHTGEKEHRQEHDADAQGGDEGWK